MVCFVAMPSVFTISHEISVYENQNTMSYKCIDFPNHSFELHYYFVFTLIKPKYNAFISLFLEYSWI